MSQPPRRELYASPYARLIDEHGHAVARDMVTSEERALVDRTAKVMGDEKRRRSFLYTGWAFTNLPHRKLPDEQSWKRSQGGVTLRIDPAYDPNDRLVGVPYGAKARVVLLYLQTQAVAHQSPTIELGSSMHDWLQRMGISVGGKTYQQIREQTRRITFSNILFSEQNNSTKRGHFRKESFVKSGSFEFISTGQQPGLWEEKITLSDLFYEQLIMRPMPILESAMREISYYSMAMDVYVWLAYRLRSIPRKQSMSLSWQSIYQQFGAGYSSLRGFRPRFDDALQAALSVYPEAQIEKNPGGYGYRLYPSPAPVETVLGSSRAER